MLNKKKAPDVKAHCIVCNATVNVRPRTFKLRDGRVKCYWCERTAFAEEMRITRPLSHRDILNLLKTAEKNIFSLIYRWECGGKKRINMQILSKNKGTSVSPYKTFVIMKIAAFMELMYMKKGDEMAKCTIEAAFEQYTSPDVQKAISEQIARRVNFISSAITPDLHEVFA